VNSAIPNDPLLNNPSRVFPVYDGHGNMVASLKRGNGSYTLANEKRYDAWGQVRYDDGVGTSDHVINPRNRFCGNLGRWDDDVLGLTYMRARWYEPTTGRFVSEDPARDGWNWFRYANQMPTALVDSSGNSAQGALLGGGALLLSWLMQYVPFASIKNICDTAAGGCIMISGMAFLAAWFIPEAGHADSLRGRDVTERLLAFMSGLAGLCVVSTISTLFVVWDAFESIPKGHLAKNAAGAFAAYVTIVLLFLAFDAIDQEVSSI
jgi:RHS repeat-associated protein